MDTTVPGVTVPVVADVVLAHSTVIVTSILTTATCCCSPVSSPRKGKHSKPDKQTADMSGNQLEAFWGLSPEDLAILQADPSFTPAPSHPTIGTLATSVCQADPCFTPATSHPTTVILTTPMSQKLKLFTTPRPYQSCLLHCTIIIVAATD